MSVKNLNETGQISDGTFSGLYIVSGRAYNPTVTVPSDDRELANKAYVHTIAGIWSKDGSEISPTVSTDVMKANVKADSISEKTNDNGVYIDGLHVKDGKAYSTVTPTNGNELCNKTYVDNQVSGSDEWIRDGTNIKVKHAGDVLKINDIQGDGGNISINSVIFGTGRAYSDNVPEQNNELANKGYVDSIVGGAGPWDFGLDNTIVPRIEGTYPVVDNVIIDGCDQALHNDNTGYCGHLDVPQFTPSIVSNELIMTSSAVFRIQFMIDGVPTIYSYPIGTAPVNNIVDLNQEWYVYADYNSGTPVLRSTNLITDLTYNDKVCCVQVYVKDAWSLDNVYYCIGLDAYRAELKMLQNTLRVSRLAHISGGAMSTPGTNEFAVTTHYMNFASTQYIIPALAQGATFQSVYTSGGGSFFNEVTSWSSVYYNNPATGTITLSNNRYCFYDVFMVMKAGTTAEYVIVLGQAQYTSDADAIAAPKVPVLPSLLTGFNFGVTYVGRFTFRKNDTTARTILSAYGSTNTNVITTSHRSLSDLSNDDHPQYIAINGRDLHQDTILMNTAEENVVTTNIDTVGGIIVKMRDDQDIQRYANLARAQFAGSVYSAVEFCGNYNGGSRINYDVTSRNGINDNLASQTGSAGMWHIKNLNNYYWYWSTAVTPTAGDVISGGVTQLHCTYANSRWEFRLPIAYNSAVSASIRGAYIDSSGTIGYLSSIREHKEVVLPLDYESIVYGVPVKSYVKKILNSEGVYVNNPDEDTRYVEIGAIAEDLEELNYELYQNFLEYTDIANNPRKIDKDGNQLPLVTPVWKLSGISYHNFICPLIYVAQKQKQKIDLDAQRITTLENQNSTLTARVNTLESELEAIKTILRNNNLMPQ